MSEDLLARAREGDGEAFGRLVEPYRRELQVHCYRILGSLADAEDLLQETLQSAWQGLAGFEGRASLRSWLYRIATNRCLNWLRSARRRPAAEWPVLKVEPPEPSRLGEVTWLEPYPDVLLQETGELGPGPEARYEMLEAISLACVTALQLLPPRQRAVLILRDVLGFRAAEVADVLQTSEESVTSALKRARATLSRDLPGSGRPLPPKSPGEQRLVEKFLDAWERADVEGIVSLLSEDACLRMPPVPLEYQGPGPISRFLATVVFREGRRYRLVQTRANGQPAFGVYVIDRTSKMARANAFILITLSGSKISAITRFDKAVLSPLGLPLTLPADPLGK